MSVNNKTYRPVWIYVVPIVTFLAITFAFFLWTWAETDRSMSTLPIAHEYKICEQNSDCVKVSTSCNGCCQEDTVNRNSYELYEQGRRVCEDNYRGAVCDCISLPSYSVCDAGVCRLILGHAQKDEPIYYPSDRGQGPAETETSSRSQKLRSFSGT